MYNEYTYYIRNNIGQNTIWLKDGKHFFLNRILDNFNFERYKLPKLKMNIKYATKVKVLQCSMHKSKQEKLLWCFYLI